MEEVDVRKGRDGDDLQLLFAKASQSLASLSRRAEQSSVRHFSCEDAPAWLK